MYMEDSYGKQSKKQNGGGYCGNSNKTFKSRICFKAEAFLNQDNSNFKKVMEKFEKFTNKKCHSKSEK